MSPSEHVTTIFSGLAALGVIKIIGESVAETQKTSKLGMVEDGQGVWCGMV